MIFLIDAGNSNIVIGACEGSRILFRERVSTNHRATALEYASLFKAALDFQKIDCADVSGAIISCVVPAVTDALKNACRRLFSAQGAAFTVRVVGPGIKTGLSIKIDNPAQLGSDLVVDAVAGINEYPLPLIIIDMGTATTVTYIDSAACYRGGMIIPGVAVSHDALVERTSQLSKVALEKPKNLIGTNTVDCIKSGIIYSNAGALDGIIERIEHEEQCVCTAVATGGLAHVIAPFCKKKIIVDDDLLLKGLALIWQKNEAGSN